MRITFLGTNGWYDTSIGSTPCTLVDTKKYYIIFDAGFGLGKIRPYLVEDKPIFMFIGHFHLDHICGLHALGRIKTKHPLTVFGPAGLKKMFRTIVTHPYAMDAHEFKFPIKPVELKEGKYKAPFNIVCRKLKHIDGCMGYRIEVDGKIVAYCADTAVCSNDLRLAKGADLLIHECAFAPGQVDNWWGHTNPEQAATLGKKARPKKMYLLHFGANAYPTLEARKKITAPARKIFSKMEVATDGLQIEV